MSQTWPVVLENDPGIRPAGKPDACFYCSERVGHPHGPDCVTVIKRVKMKYIFEIEIDIPHFWDREQIEFHRNDSSWCASNALDDIEKFVGDTEENPKCACDCFSVEYVETVDETPRRSE